MLELLLTFGGPVRLREIGDYDRVGDGARFFDEGAKRPKRNQPKRR